MSVYKLNQYYMSCALRISEESDCIRRHVGCVAVNVKNKEIVLTGYNHCINGQNYCNKNNCYRTKNNIPSGEMLDHCLALHAEQDIICRATNVNIDLSKCDIFITHHPCITCLKLLIASNIKRIYYMHDYPVTDDIMNEIINHNDINLIKLSLIQ